MATISVPLNHLPQLPDPRPISAPASPLEMYGQMMGIKSAQQQMDQRQAMAPLQQQEAQQGVQSGQLDVEAKQRTANDQKAMSATMQQWGKTPSSAASSPGEQLSGGTPLTVKGPAGAGAGSPGASGSAPASTMPSYDDLVPLAIKNGASFPAVQALQAHVLDMKAKVGAILKDQSQAGQDNANTIRTNNGIITDAIGGVMNLPDAQLAQGILGATRELAQNGVFDQPHVQLMQSLAQQAQSGDVAGARNQLNILNTGLGAFSKELESQQKLLANKKSQAEDQFYQQNGGAPGVPAEMMQQADWLKKNPGKGPSDYKLWTLQHTPTAMVMNNQLGGPQNSDALDFAANNYRQTGQMPAGFSRSPQTTTAIIQRAAQLDQGAGGSGIAANKALLKANADSLKKLQTNFDQVQAFEGTAERNIDLLQQTAKKIPDLGARFANIPVRMINANMIGTDNMAAFKTALNTAQTESAKVLNSSNASGVLSDSARHELQDVIDGNVPYSALVASLNTLKQDMGNRKTSYQMQIQDIQNRIKPAGQTGTATGTQSGGTGQQPGQPGGGGFWSQISGAVAH